MEKFYVYILYSPSHEVYYKGFSLDVFKRLEEHNQGKSEYTRSKMPWELKFYCSFATKREALIYEKKLKKQHRQYIEWLIQQPINEI